MTIERNQGQHLEISEIKKPSKTYNRMSQPQVSHHQARFNEGLNKRYSPNYVNQYQSPLGSIPGQDMHAVLMELANIQSRSMEMMAASQRSQQEAFQELTRASVTKQMMQYSFQLNFWWHKQTSFWRLDQQNWPSLQSKWQRFQDWNLQEIHRSCVTSGLVLWWIHRRWTSCKIEELFLSCTNNEWS